MHSNIAIQSGPPEDTSYELDGFVLQKCPATVESCSDSRTLGMSPLGTHNFILRQRIPSSSVRIPDVSDALLVLSPSWYCVSSCAGPFTSIPGLKVEDVVMGLIFFSVRRPKPSRVQLGLQRKAWVLCMQCFGSLTGL